MKNTFFVIVIGVTTLSACNNNTNENESVKSNKINDGSTEHVVQRILAFTSPLNRLLQIYLQMKIPFAKDNDKGALKLETRC